MFCESKGKAKGGRLAYPVWMRVTVLYFGVLKDVMGHRSAVMEVAEGASVAELLALHRSSGKAAASVWDSIAVAVNQEYARVEDVLKDGDEVALLPPVSGGCNTKSNRQEQKQMRGFFPIRLRSGSE
jgi:molybdopterin converting factor subunit 1